MARVLGCLVTAGAALFAGYQIMDPNSIMSEAYAKLRTEPVQGYDELLTLQSLPAEFYRIHAGDSYHLPHTGLRVKVDGLAFHFTDYRPPRTVLGPYSRSEGENPVEDVIPGFAEVDVYREGDFLGTATFARLNSFIFPKSDFSPEGALRQVGLSRNEIRD